MTQSSTPSTPISIATLILLAYKRAGLLPVEATTGGANMSAKLTHGKQLLDLIMDNLAVEGFIARTMSFYDLTVVASTGSYVLPDTLLDVYEDAMFTETGSTSELVCKQMDSATWQTLTTKSSTSTRPQLYLALRTGATVTVKFWPIPSAGGVMRFKTVRLFGDNSTTSNTPDLQRYWLDVLVWMLAYYVAVDSSMPAEKVNFLGAISEQKKKDAIRYSFEHTSQVASFSYPTQWSE